MSTPSSNNSFKQLEEHFVKKLNAQMVQQNLKSFWEKVKDIQDDIEPRDGNTPAKS